MGGRAARDGGNLRLKPPLEEQAARPPQGDTM